MLEELIDRGAGSSDSSENVYRLMQECTPFHRKRTKAEEFRASDVPMIEAGRVRHIIKGNQECRQKRKRYF